MARYQGRRVTAIAATLVLLVLAVLGLAGQAGGAKTRKLPSARGGRNAAAKPHRSRRSKRADARRGRAGHHAKPHRKPRTKHKKPKPGGPGGGTGEGAETPAAGGGEASGSSNPFAGIPMYVGETGAASAAREWAAQGRSAEAAELAKVAGQPQAQWFGDWSDGHGGTAGDVGWWVGAASAGGTLPVIVAYDLPGRDCSGYSGGGAANAAAYRQFIDAMAAGIAGRRTVVILEPDALAELSCLSAEQQASYYELLSYAVSRLGESPAVSVYLDAGNAGWQPAATIAARLRQAGVARARGFSLNVSNFDTTASETAYGEAIDRELGGGAHFIVDTSRNGNGPAPGGAWCNPPGRALGMPPTAVSGNAALDAYVWVKRPGESDGTCNGGPAAGTFWPQYALSLALSASW